MPILRLTQSAVTPERFCVESSLEGDGLLRQTATAEFDFAITAQDREDFRWYFEDYLLHVADPAPKIAERIEGRIREIGAEVFKATFQTNHDARNLWAACATAGNGKLQISEYRDQVPDGATGRHRVRARVEKT